MSGKRNTGIWITNAKALVQQHLISTGGAKPGMDLVATKWVGIEGTSIIAKEKEAELSGVFPPDFLETAKAFDQYLSVLPEGRIAAAHGAAAMHDVTEGGISGALWEMAESSGVGIEVEAKDIPIRQETIEIAEHYGINPYGLISSGCMLIATTDGTGLIKKLSDAAIPAAVIGKATEGKDRILHMDGITRYLEPPKTDELYKVL